MAPKADAKAKAKPKKEPKKVEEGEADEKPRVEQPDKAAFDAQTKVITDSVNELQDKLKSLSAQIGERSTGKDEFFQQKATLRDQIMTESDAIGTLMKNKDDIIKSMKDSKEAVRANKNELGNMRKKLGFNSTDEIDDRIATIEFKLWTESLTLKEEKKLLEEIKMLKKDKPKIAEYNSKEAQVSVQMENSAAAAGDTRERLTILNEMISGHRDRKKELNEQLTALIQSRNEQMGDMPELFTQRDTLNQEIRALIQNRDKLRTEYKDKERAYYEYLREQRELRQEKARADRDKWNKEREQEQRRRKVEKLDEQPHTQEITLLEQTIKFCKSFQPKEDATIEEKKETSYDNPETHVVLVSKHSREEEFYFAPTKKGKAARAAKKKGGDGSSAKAIKHNAETFKLFANLNLNAPITTDDIPATLEQLEAKMAYYRQKIEEWEGRREEEKRKIMAGEDEEEEADAAPANEEGEDGDKEES